MQNLSDKEYANILLEQHKLAASSMTNLILESANQNLRNDAANILNRTFQHQKQLFDIMAQKGWYKVQSANQQDISRAQQEMSTIKSQMNLQ